MSKGLLLWVACVIASLLVGANGQCPSGFTGPECGICLTNEACVLLTNVEEAECFTGFAFSNITTVKTFTCNPTSPELVTGLLQPDSLLMRCYTGLEQSSTSEGGVAPPSVAAAAPEEPLIISSADDNANGPVAESALTPPLAPVASPSSAAPASVESSFAGKRRLHQEAAWPMVGQQQPYCEIGFTVSDPRVRVACRADSCAIQPGSARVVCDSTTCSCVDDPTCGGGGLTFALVSSVTGRADVSCDDTNRTCEFKLGGLPVQSIGAACAAGECLIPSRNFFNGTNSTSESAAAGAVSNLNINPVVAAIPTIALTLTVAFLGVYTWANRGLWDQNAGSGPNPDLTFAMARPAVKALEFRNLAVTVPMSASAAERKRAALRTKALVRHATMHTLQHKPTLVHKITKGAATRLGLKTSDDVEVHAPPRSLSQDDGHAADFVASLHETGDPNSWSVLKDCSGVALAGELVGILGPSGCGKTTLLGAIAGSSLDLGTTATLKGEILVDGMPRIGRQVAYVPQADPLIPTLTVQECVRYSALLRLPRDTPAGEINARVEGVLGELGLTHVADSQVGGSGRIRGISGGERRRVTIAMELVTDPSIIVLDEPTSGLDSFNCSRLLRSLRHVAAGGRVVLASLHQPSHDMFFALDRVILMGHGRMLFAGRPEEAEGALAAAGVPCPNGAAVAEHMLKVASSPGDLMAVLQAHKAILGYGGVDGAATSRLEVLDENERSSNKIALNSQESPLARPSLVPGSRPSSASDSQRSISTPQSPEASLHFANGSKSVPTGLKSFSPPELDLQPVEGAMLADSMQASTAPGAGFTRQLAILFWRTAIDIFRNPTLLLLHVTIAACVGVLIGAIFFDLETSSIGVQNRMGGTFFALAFLAFTSLTTVDLLMNERAVVVREVRSGYYSPTSYLLAKLALDGMLLRVIPAIMFWLPFYYMAGLRTGAAYAATYAFALQAFNCAIGALSMAVTVASATAGQSSFIMNFLLLFSLAFAGFLVNVNSIPAALRWIHYLSPFYFAFEAMTTSELNGQSFTFKYQASPDAPVIEVPDITGETFLASLGFNTSNTTLDLAILVAMYAGFVLLALALFLSKLPRTKRTQSALGDEEKMGAATSKVSPMRGSTAGDNTRRTI